ncbi:M50 family metallopeptidase [Legionella longbeachae]|uniref:Putative membrane-associated metalloprotease proteins n=1 Tax=Legionella longbeachae serogroup 1 (strain NSW150) TaxID=661367 RepID=D3HPT1_LEGLN|nr:site-2 protease family protein [Legionella longbeachae]VEE01417.1 metalloprotease [Legionella oakridgensis]HBD7396135.1 site-2 protease family protein [Legionella pneumophila]ARB92219.1 peptidase [Legionella longbeachae]ARM34600.1 peptidase [Legionella longbeachae]EEZ96106.1 membrane associated zinc metalloprotease [Legionella longbeachae D-4968]
MLLAIIAIILTLLLVVGIHEGGHAILARFFQVKIKKISIGFGKPLLRWRGKSGCEWIWAFFPLGGYVQLENTRISPVKPAEYPGCFDKKPVWQRILILLAGAVANLITAWFAFVFVYSVGLSYHIPEIKEVQVNSTAAQAGMLPGDMFVSIGDHATPTWSDVGMQLVILWGKKGIPVVLNRSDGNKANAVLDLSHVQFRGARLSLLAQLGIQPNLSAAKSKLRASSFIDAIYQANDTMMHMTYFFLVTLKQLFSGIIPFSALLGPIGIFAASVASLTQGIVVFTFFIATLSLAVAVINLFPIPGLDGGSIVYALVEKIRGKPVSVAMELLLHRLVFIIFCVVLVHLLMNDLQRL